MQHTPYNYAEYHIRRHTLTKRAHMSEETGPPRKMHQRIRIRIKEYTIQQKIRPRGCQVGSGNPLGRPNLAWFRPGALRGGVAAKAPDHLPYVRWRETDL